MGGSIERRGRIRLKKDQYGLLPQISEEARNRITEEVRDFAELFEGSPEQARADVEGDIEKIEVLHNNKYLAIVVRTAVDAAMDMVRDKLTHEDWMNVQLFLLKGQLLVLELLNRSIARQEG